MQKNKMEKISVESKAKIAYASWDYNAPLGTRRDNSSNHIFNEKLYKLYGDNQINLLDIGCSGGEFVKEMIDDGHIAVGLEGSDYSKRFRRGAWREIPEFLFTCDITKPFNIYISPPKRLMSFDFITAWEVMEHIEKRDIGQLIKNIVKHMSENGMWIMSIANCPSISNGVDLHRTQETKEWWIKKFEEFGLTYVDNYVKYFNTQFVRGKYETQKSFHIVVCKNPSKLPEIPKVSVTRWLWERWVGSGTQEKVGKILLGSAYKK